MKANINYKPSLEDALMFLRDEKKSGYVESYSALGTLLKLEYPALEDQEIIKYLRAFARECGDIKPKEGK